MEETKDNAAAAEQSAAQPDTGTAPAKSAAEIKLEGQLAAAVKKGEGYKKERDAARTDLSTAQDTITAQGQELEQLRGEKAQAAEAAQAKADAPADEQPQATTQEPSEADVIKDVLKRNGLKVAYMLPSGACFSEAHAREFAGDDFDSLIVIRLD